MKVDHSGGWRGGAAARGLERGRNARTQDACSRGTQGRDWIRVLLSDGAFPWSQRPPEVMGVRPPRLPRTLQTEALQPTPRRRDIEHLKIEKSKSLLSTYTEQVEQRKQHSERAYGRPRSLPFGRPFGRPQTRPCGRSSTCKVECHSTDIMLEAGHHPSIILTILLQGGQTYFSFFKSG